MPALDLTFLVPIVEEMILLDTVRFTTPAGPPVLDPATGRQVQEEGDILYEGPGAVQPASTPGGVSALPAAGQPWVDETSSRYKVLTPLSAPIAPRDTIVTVTAVRPVAQGGDPALIGRQWRTLDPSAAATLGVVRITGLDQVQQSSGDA